MKNKVFSVIGLAFILLFFRFTSYTKPAVRDYDITIKIHHIKDTVAYLGYHFGDQKFVKDTSAVMPGGVLHFTGTAVLPEGIYFLYTPNIYFELLMDSQQHFTIETDTADFIGQMKVTGSKDNKIFNEFQQYMAEKQKESSEISAKIKELDKQKDSDQISTLQSQLGAIGTEVKTYQQMIIQNNPGTFVARLVKAMQRPEVPDPPAGTNGKTVDKSFQFYYYKNHFFDNFDLSDPALLRTPMYQPKIDEYMDKLTYQHPDSIDQAVDYLLGLAESNQETFRYLLVKLTNKYETSNIMGMERVFVYLAENYYLKGKAYWADSALVAKFDKRVKELKPNLVGNKAPEMILRDTLLRPVRLSSLHNRFIVLYFYDPDCGHCKKSTPVLRELYQRLKEKDVEVVGACIVTDIDKWKNYIKDFKLNWVNLADPYYQSNFRADYDIKSTPTIYILDKNKEIIAKRLGVDQIEDFINRMIQIEDQKS